MLGPIQRIFSKKKRREHTVVRELKRAKECIARKDHQCTIEHLNEAIRHDDCTVCREELEVFKKQFRKLPVQKRLKKLDLFIQVSGPAAFIVPRMKQIRMIKPPFQQKRKQRRRNR